MTRLDEFKAHAEKVKKDYWLELMTTPGSNPEALRKEGTFFCARIDSVVARFEEVAIRLDKATKLTQESMTGLVAAYDRNDHSTMWRIIDEHQLLMAAI